MHSLAARIALLVPMLAGCSTIALQQEYWSGGEVGWPLLVYGGTTLDLAMTFRAAATNSEASIGALLIFDAPFSLVADTLLLPLCAYEQVEKARRPAPERAGPSD